MHARAHHTDQQWHEIEVARKREREREREQRVHPRRVALKNVPRARTMFLFSDSVSRVLRGL